MFLTVNAAVQGAKSECRVAPRIAPTEEDQQALATARTLFSMLQTSGGPATQPQALDQRQLQFAAQLARELQPLLPELFPGVLATGKSPSCLNE